MEVKLEGDCCADCLEYIANGTVPENRPAYVEALTIIWGNDLKHAVVACGDDCEGPFSWYGCEFCNSMLGGERHRFAILAPKEANG